MTGRAPAGIDPLTCPEYPRCTHVATSARDLARHTVAAHDYAPSDGMVRDGEASS